MDFKVYEKYIDRLIDKAPDYGFDDCRVSLNSGTSMSVSIYKGEVSSYENSTDQSIGFAGKKNGQLGKASSTTIDDETVEFLLKSASENCDILNDEDEEFIYCDPEHPVLESIQLSGNWHKNTYKRFSELGLELEKAALEMDPRVRAVDALSLGCSTGKSMMVNSQGLHMYKESDYLTVYIGVRGEEDGVVKSAGHFWYGNDIDKFDKDTFISELKDRLIPKFGARSVSSGTYDIILGNEATMSLLSAFIPSFSSYGMAKGISLLAGKEGTVIASDVVTLREDPMSEYALSKVPFDDEGVLTQKKDLISKGVFNTAVYNLKTAAMTGHPTTGNGFGGALSVSNMILLPGTSDLKTLAEHVGNGIYITEISGLHAGLNPISGDFSLLAEGYVIEDGKIGRAVEQITVSDNFYKVLLKIREVGSDILTLPEGSGEYSIPSVIIDDIAIAGEKTVE